MAYSKQLLLLAALVLAACDPPGTRTLGCTERYTKHSYHLELKLMSKSAVVQAADPADWQVVPYFKAAPGTNWFQVTITDDRGFYVPQDGRSYDFNVDADYGKAEGPPQGKLEITFEWRFNGHPPGAEVQVLVGDKTITLTKAAPMQELDGPGLAWVHEQTEDHCFTAH